MHPDAQVKLAKMFAEAVRLDKQVILTTHSGMVLLALKPLVESGEIKSEDVAVYHFEKGREGTVVKRLEMTPNGVVKGWVPSFAEVESKLIKEWMKALPELK